MRALALCALLSACGGADQSISTARDAIAATASAGAEADVLIADECYRSVTPLAADSPEECSKAVDAVKVTRDTLLTAQEAVDAWEAGADGDHAVRVLACVVGALDRLTAALVTLRIPVPEALGDALRLAGNFARAQCPGGR